MNDDTSEPSSSSRPLPRIISDTPEESQKPQFGFDEYAQSMADVIANPANKTPLVIGLAIGCCAGAPGAMMPGSCAHRTDSGTCHQTGSTMLGFDVPGRSANPLSFIFFSFLLLFTRTKYGKVYSSCCDQGL